ncbi:MAG TPA: L-2-hydroxyglutarate oxidase [Candidatus Limnocylindrales bacterium]|nr:L-2-hydroxyglutarate oxidase [Candidatus Limnocylindrales bacterium]
MNAERGVDVAIVGGGIVGLATARRLLEARPRLRLAVLEKEAELATHQSGHNSGVIHAGLYYAPGSLKARLCREGKADLEAFCEAKGIPFERVGKLVVALDEGELARFEGLRQRAEANGVPGLEVVGPERIREIEPHVAGIRGLWSPTTGIVDFRRVAMAFADEVAAAGGEIRTGWPLTSIAAQSDGLVLRAANGQELVARSVIACAGLWADRVAAMTGDDGPASPRIVPFRGDYYTLTPGARSLIRGLVYPVPDPRFPFLGVHFTKRHDGEVWAGPNAVLAFARAGYRRRDISIRDLAGTLTYPGFIRLASRYLRTGLAEMWRDLSKRAYVGELQRYVPDITADHLVFGPSGVRAQALARDGSMVDDFDLAGSGRVLHVRNAPSPAATASLAIGRLLSERAIEQFGL